MVLILSAWVLLFSPSVEIHTSKFQTAGAVPSAEEILDAAERAMGEEAARTNIHSISAIAKCHGRKGDYETRFVAARDGNLSFQQFFSDHKNIAGILDGRGWQLAENGRYEWIDATETFVLRSHEFPLVAPDLRKRFHDWGQFEYCEGLLLGQPMLYWLLRYILCYLNSWNRGKSGLNLNFVQLLAEKVQAS